MSDVRCLKEDVLVQKQFQQPMQTISVKLLTLTSHFSITGTSKLIN